MQGFEFTVNIPDLAALLAIAWRILAMAQRTHTCTSQAVKSLEALTARIRRIEDAVVKIDPGADVNGVHPPPAASAGP